MSAADEKVEVAEAKEAVVKEDAPMDCTNPDVVTKYKLAGEIANDAIREAAKLCVAGANIAQICQTSDAYILQRTAAVFKGKKVDKGVGFPTCISVNHVIDHFAPAEGAFELKQGDVVKIDLGVNIDGFVAIGAHTLVLTAEGEVVEGPKANVVAAVHYAREAAQRVVKAGNKGKDLQAVLEKVASEFGVTQIQTIMSHQIERCKLDGKKSVVNRPDPGAKQDNVEFLPGEAYLIDVVFSTGEGKGRPLDEVKATIYKREAEAVYMLKRQASRAVLAEIKAKSPSFPFHTRTLEQKNANFGLVECVQHNLVSAYPVLQEREGQFVAHAKFTLLLLPGGQVRITGVPIDMAALKPDKQIQDKELLELLQQGAGGSKNKKKKANKNKKKAADAAPAQE